MITKTRTMKLALALLMSASVGTLAIAAPVSAQEDAEFNRFANSGYTYCDAKLMGALYGQDPYQGKLIIGQKIANGIEDNIPLILAESRSMGNRCEWADLPHTYEDAEQLAALWGVDVEEAKAKAAVFYTDGMPDVVVYTLGSTEDHHDDGEHDYDNEPALSAFFAAGFNYCDAKLVGTYFDQTPYDGKIFIGSKIKAGMIENVPWYLDRARAEGAVCEWSDLPYDYSDAERLAGMWYKDVEQTKAAITQLVMMGRTDIVNASLGR